MARMSHGTIVSLETVQSTIDAIVRLNAGLAAPIMVAPPRRLTEFGYMFGDLQVDSKNLLPEGENTVANLKRLGETMRDSNPSNPLGDNGDIPAAYTYLGQFIDHDITLETQSDTFSPLDAVAVLSAEEVLQRIKNQRSATLDLDSVYEPPAVFDGQNMKLGKVSISGDPVPGKDMMNDLPRSGRDRNAAQFDRFALIGDSRNDENLIVAQLHLAFLRAHNEIVRRGNTWDTARRILRQLYQWIVIEDFLRKIAGDAIVDKILSNGNQFFVTNSEKFFMPLEFSVAAYRFGHSMVRNSYDFNVNFGSTGILGPGSLNFLFTFTALSGDLGVGNGFDTLPENWVIQWENFVNASPNPTRKIDTRLVEPLFHLRDVKGIEHMGIAARLATRNLLRGYKLRMPSGQAIATKMGISQLDSNDIMNLILTNANSVGMTEDDKTALQTSGFDSGTPLWFYILAESELLEGGIRLGPVGGTIVAEVLIGLIRHSADSILALGEGWDPSQFNEQLEQQVPPEFNLSDLLKLAGVL